MSLRISIVGAGPVGLAAAIALAKASSNHDIHVYERSQFKRETGAAFHINPQVVRILERWGIDVEEDMKGCRLYEWNHIYELGIGGRTHERKFDWRERSAYLGIEEPELMIHRIDAHNVLREHAEALSNVTLHLGAKVRSVEAESGTLVFEDGTRQTADLVVGADGIHSACVQALSSSANPMTISRLPINVYRMLVPAQDALADPDVGPFLRAFDWQHTLNHYHDKEHREFVLYPCRNGELLNIATFLRPDMDTDNIDLESYQAPGSVESVHKALEPWPTHFHKLVELAKGGEITHWAISERDVPDSFVKGRLVLVGDAAHPMPPTHAAGATSGIEEAAALGAIFRDGVGADKVEEVLRLYNELRYQRGTTFKYRSNWFYSMRHDHGMRDALHAKIKQRCGEAATWPSDEEIVESMWTHEPEQEVADALAQVEP